MCRPNLFTYASTELSQDAFLCWLLHWASPECSQIDEPLYKCGMDLLRTFFRKSGKTLPEPIISIAIKRQVGESKKQAKKNHRRAGRIDILVMIETPHANFAVIVEDKINSKEHSDQLSTYLSYIYHLTNLPAEQVLPIYLKTGDQSSYAKVKEQKYIEYLRPELLELLSDCRKRYAISNPILSDFIDHLDKREREVTRFRDTEIEDWAKPNSPAWYGFFSRLRQEMGKGGWDYVPNPSKGFIGFALPSKPVEDIRINILLVERNLHFKIMVKDPSLRKKLRQSWVGRLMRYSNSLRDNLKLVKLNRHGHGNNMTVAMLDGTYLVKTPSGLVDIKGTIAVITECERVLNVVVEEAEGEVTSSTPLNQFLL